ncbi:NAD(P)/FAD-dependent oxidoreductase [Peribacillus acanthi]|uniref:NAD(P)/FAD-dependent oxidoreductase n=1 Tax=Peribacillus acanthi TaxID=2171554 RepID=UPI000D3EDCAB|nr:NAD(P)/FAD-dependent oxidoreductase [Peribacillus acanthi]
MKVDVVIVGGGPAGLSAAIEIGKRGGKVALVDDHPKLGGKLLGQLHQDGRKTIWWKGNEIAQSLERQALDANVKFLIGKQVWGLEHGWKVHVSDLVLGEEGLVIDSDAVLLATGAVEKPIPLPGWTLPGVISIGAAQVMTNVYQVLPGKNVLIVGIDMLSLSIAQSMKIAGAKIQGIYMLPSSPFSNGATPLSQLESLKHMTDYAPSCFIRLSGKLLQKKMGQKIAAKLYPRTGVKMWGIPIHLRKTLLSINGDQQVNSVTVTTIDIDGNPTGSLRNIEVDAVCISGGLSPLYELAANAGCKFVKLEGLSGTVPLHNRELQTTIPKLFVAGNITGIEGAKVAMAQGKLAGQSICKTIGIGKIYESDIEDSIAYVDELRKLSDIQFHPNVADARQQLEKHWQQWKLVNL